MAGSKNDVVIGKNADFSQAGAPNATSSENNGLVTDGKIWIGSTSTNAGGTHINVGQVVTANSTVQFGYNTPNISLDFNKQNIAFGTSMPALTSGISNLVIGVFGSGSAITSGNQNILLGSFNGSKLTLASDNVFIGATAGNTTTLSSRNVAIGSATLINYGTGTSTDGNIAIGYGSLGNLTSGTRNLVIGYFVGNNYTTTESSNILIGNAGTTAESNVIKIGTTGSGQQQQNKTFIAAITGVTVSGSAPIGIDTNGQLSSLGFGSTDTVFRSNGASSSPTYTTNFKVSSSDVMTNTSQPSFFAYNVNPVSNVTGDGTQYVCQFDTEVSDQGSNFASNTFTAPVAGTYLFTCGMYASGIVAQTVLNLQLVTNGGTKLYFIYCTPTGIINGSNLLWSGSAVVKLAVNEAVNIVLVLSGSTKTVSWQGGAIGGNPPFFSGSLLC